VKSELLLLDASAYERHALHDSERAWVETNCYVDLWIEVLHSYGFDPTAALAFTVALDFEGDQWLFFKQPTADLYALYGVDVQELNIWRNLLDHAEEQLARGRLVLVEVDAHYLPDTAGVSYRVAHSKTTIGIQSLDRAGQTLGYFHNAGYFTLSGDDFVQLFGVGRDKRADELAPYTEFAKLDPRVRLSPEELLAGSLRQLVHHLRRRPEHNPIPAFRACFERDIAWLRDQPQEVFHQYAFATLRQCGANFELAASYMGWLLSRGEQGIEPVQQCFDTLASQAKGLQFKAARAVLLKKNVDFAPMFDAMQDAWERANLLLAQKYLSSSRAPCIASAG
jgi:hypothetical protein